MLNYLSGLDNSKTCNFKRKGTWHIQEKGSGKNPHKSDWSQEEKLDILKKK